MKFDAYIEERVVRMTFELKMLDVIKKWHVIRGRVLFLADIHRLGRIREYFEMIESDVPCVPFFIPPWLLVKIS